MLTGILFILLGIWVFSTPLVSYLSLVWLFKVGFFVVGILEVFHAFANRDSLGNWGWALVGGIVNILFAVLLFKHPVWAIETLPIYVGFIVLFRSSMGIALAFDLKRWEAKGWAWSLVSALLGVAFSFFMIWDPFFGGLAIVIYTAMSIIMLGIMQIVFSVALKNLQ